MAFSTTVRETKIRRSTFPPPHHPLSRRDAVYFCSGVYTSGKDLKLLVVSVEPDEAVVLQVKLDPVKLSDFINEHAGEGDRNGR